MAIRVRATKTKPRTVGKAKAVRSGKGKKKGLMKRAGTLVSR